MATHRQWYALEVYQEVGTGWRALYNYLFAGALDESGPDTSAGFWEWVHGRGRPGWRPLDWAKVNRETVAAMGRTVRGLVGCATSERIKVAHAAFPTTPGAAPGAYPSPYLVEGVLVATERPGPDGMVGIYVPTNPPGAPTPGGAGFHNVAWEVKE
jgi:hypothetical protein